MTSTPQPDLEAAEPGAGEPEWPPPGDVAAFEPGDFNVGLTAAKCGPLIPKEIG